MIYCGTTTGDILKINFETKLLVEYGPKKTRFSLGAETVAYSKEKVLTQQIVFFDLLRH